MSPTVALTGAAVTLHLLAGAKVRPHLLPVATDQGAWRRLDVVFGALFVAADPLLPDLVATGQVTTTLRGGGGLLP